MMLMDYLASHVLAVVLSAALLGLLVGSFLNVLIYRLPIMMQREWRAQALEYLECPPEPVRERFNLLLPNSRCPHCDHQIRAWENIPLVSWLALRGKCSSCRAPISSRYPLVELACGLLSGYVAWHFGFTWQAGAMLLLTWGLVAMSMIDIDHQLLPDSLVLPLLWLGLILNNFGLFVSLESALWGAVAGYLSLWSVYWLFMLVAMSLWVKRAPSYQASQLFSHFEWPRWPMLRHLLSVGVPIGVAVFAEASIFSVIALLIGALGATVVAGHQIALNFTSLIFMIPLSLGMAVTVRIGQELGRNAPRDARFVAGVGIGAALVYACFSASAMLLFSEQIARIYTPDPAVVAVAASLFLYAALFQFSDVVQVTAAGALRGYQDTRMTMVYTLFAYWGIGLPLGYLLGLTDHLGAASGPAGLWQGLIAGLSCAALLLSVRLARSARREIRRHTALRRAAV